VTFYADLHVHSKYSRATGQDADLERFSLWARKKGLAVVATGDFTHPAWFAELRGKLVPAEAGLFRLRPDIEREIESRLPAACRAQTAPTRFVLEVEISTIYRKGDRTRKVHHLILVPSLENAERVTQSLTRIGNLKSDGRPILGLDSRHLLDITLNAGEGCFLIPAHIWTPWFSVLGSKSGFDSVAECYGDLAPHVFALETGLSSDPPMNARVSALDAYRLVSNSDAHSPPKLGREACVFGCDMTFDAIRGALATGQGYGGTIEFFPEEGKYHLDGHRKCDVRLMPAESKHHNGLCPECGKPLTIGVMNRVEELADRSEDESKPPPFRSAVPLAEILGELMGVGPQSRSVEAAYESLLERVAPELPILLDVPIEALGLRASPRFVEAIRRVRTGKVIREGGYDGEYGVIRLFTGDEAAADDGAPLLLDVAPAARSRRRSAPKPGPGARPVESAVHEPPPDYVIPSSDRTGLHPALAGLDPEQREAARVPSGPVLIVAGPGTGKTRTLTHRIAWLVEAQGVAPERCLAVTFTNRAADEMCDRLAALLPGRADRVRVTTFHGFGYRLLSAYGERAGFTGPIRVCDGDELRANIAEALGLSRRDAEARMRANPPDAAVEAAKRSLGLVGFDELIAIPARVLRENADVRQEARSACEWMFVDEYQDVDAAQHELVRLLVPPGGNLTAIGDPDQAIYGFRGSDAGFFQRFADDFGPTRVVTLTRNYRSAGTIVEAALQAIQPGTLVPGRGLHATRKQGVRLIVHESPTEAAESEYVVHTVEELVGGSGFFSFDSGRVDSTAGDGTTGFADIAVLYRAEAQADSLAHAFERSGIPYQRRSHRRLLDFDLARAVFAAADAGRDDNPAACVARALADAAADTESRVLADALRALAARHESVASFRCALALASDADLWDPRADRVSLLTLHAAKGLEFGAVFIVGCEDGLLPMRFGSGRDNPEEERRLFFVGITRARERLFLCRARRRPWRGETREFAPSPFLHDIEGRLLDRRQSATLRHKPAADRQLDLF
jgi:uncharacterized protein (TIGR00375 family)